MFSTCAFQFFFVLAQKYSLWFHAFRNLEKNGVIRFLSSLKYASSDAYLILPTLFHAIRTAWRLILKLKYEQGAIKKMF